MEVLWEEFVAWFHFVRSTGEDSWYFYTLTAMLVYGVYQYWFDHSVTTHRKETPLSVIADVTVAGATMSVTLLSAAYLSYLILIKGEWILDLSLAVFLGMLQGILFLLLNVFRLRARSHYPQHVVLPVTKSSILLVILVSWFLFGELESLTESRLAGFVLIGLSLLLISGGKKGGSTLKADASGKPTVTMAAPWVNLMMAILISAAIALLTKYAVGPSNLNIAQFIFFSNFFTCIVALGMTWQGLRGRKDQSKKNPELIRDVRKSFGTGLRLGVVNLVAYGALLADLSVADASVVIPIHSLYIIVPILLAAIVDGEKLTDQVTTGVVLSVIAFMVLKA